jgi:predicted nucleic acid-binding protein
VKPSVYLETSVISYLVGRLSRDVVVLGNQELTREWWTSRRGDYELFISEVVTVEAAIGAPDLARHRVEICETLPLLAISDEAERLAPLLLRAAGMAPNAATDALHVAVAAVHGMEYLLSWNCTHIADATIRRAIDRQCRASGYDPPVICTPQELIGGVGHVGRSNYQGNARGARGAVRAV